MPITDPSQLPAKLTNEQLLATPLGFSKLLDIDLHPWQSKVFLDVGLGNRVALKAANGSGKTSCLAAPLVLWWCTVYPKSQVVTTAGVYRQVKEQLWQRLAGWRDKLKGWTLNATDLTAPNGSKAIGFSTDEPNRFEGWHNDKLLMIFDEAKSIPTDIWRAAERCQPTAWLAMSSTGGMDGEFAQCFLGKRKYWKNYSVSAYDCPHIKKEWIDMQIEQHGRDNPFIRSMIFSEFMGEDDGISPFTFSKIHNCRSNPPKKQEGAPVAFIDWAGGGDETVIAIRRGNVIEPLIGWKDSDTMRSVGKAIVELKKANLRPNDVWADDGGLGKPMNDRMREQGWAIKRVNFGARAYSDNYVNRSSEIWWETARQIERAEIILPADELLDAQLCSRKAKIASSGKLGLESKDEMRRRGVCSPDRGDAVCGVCCVRSENNLAVFDSGNTGSDQWSDMQEYSEGEPACAGFDIGG
jgi:phage terminase large subunit